MLEIILFEIISIVSLLYSLWMMFFYFAPIGEMFLVFMWTILGSMVFALNYSKSKIYETSILLLLLPLIFYNDKKSVFFILVATILIYLYIKKSLFKGNYYVYVYQLRWILLLYIVVIFIRLLLDGVKGSISYASPFIIVYLLSSIMLVRTIRHLDSRMSMEKIRRNNIKYLVIIFVVFSIAAFDSLREFIWKPIEKGLDGLITAVFYPLYLFCKNIDPPTETPIEEMMEYEPGMDEAADMEVEELRNILEEYVPWDFTMFKRILGVLLALVLIYIVYKVIMKAGYSRGYKSIEYTEEREYIKKPKKRKKLFRREKYPRELREQIRYYYRRYLDKLIKEDINISNSDTSTEINEKAEEIFGKEIEEIRDIYIYSRYSSKEVDEGMVEKMKTLYKKLTS